MSASDDPVLPLEIVVLPWRDDVVEAVGFAVGHAYVETLWLPIIGPSATWALRRLGAWVTACPTESR